jgi:hypothetical protein
MWTVRGEYGGLPGTSFAGARAGPSARGGPVVRDPDCVANREMTN